MWLDGQIDWFVVLIAVWLGSVGGVIGSFLNVVVYRWPLGMSVVRPASRCPRCHAPIRWHDNLPVIGWILLGGRCRTCATKISPRYPAVEAVVAMFFVLLAANEFCLGGERESWGAARAGFHAPWASDLSSTAVWLRYWMQILLGLTLLAAGLIDFDREGAPPRLFVASIVMSVAIPFVWREARPLPFDLGWERLSPTLPPARQQWMDMLLGASTALGWIFASWNMILGQRQGRWTMALALSAIGVTLGWQLTAVVGAIWIVGLMAACAVRGRRPSNGLLGLAVAAGLVLLVWRAAFSAIVTGLVP